MDFPVICYCSHLFDKSEIDQGEVCPKDKWKLVKSNCFPQEALKRSIETWKATQAANALSMQTARLSIDEPPSPFQKVSLAHQDDIHGFAKISPYSFVSGSKDNTLAIWDLNGNNIKTFKPASTQGYKYWMTALCSFSDGTWASGTRDGYVDIWSEKGEKLREIKYHSGTQSACKQRNQQRINCISELENRDGEVFFYTGTAKFFQLWSSQSGKMLKYYQAHDNDWVYCIDTLDKPRHIVVIGSDLEIWNMKQNGIERTPVVKEEPHERRARQRPHISCIQRLEHDPSILSAAFFDGSVRLIDLAAQKVVRSYTEHTKDRRVWSVINLAPHILASSSDDSTIKIWDARMPKAIETLGGNPGRVSSLLRLTKDVFISGSCPDNPHESETKGEISFWNIKKLVPQK